MKKLFNLSVILLSTCLFINCSRDNNDNNDLKHSNLNDNNNVGLLNSTEQKKSILGKWYSDSSNDHNINFEFLESGEVIRTLVGYGWGGTDVIDHGSWYIAGPVLKSHYPSLEPEMQNEAAKILNLVPDFLEIEQILDGRLFVFSFHR